MIVNDRVIALKDLTPLRRLILVLAGLFGLTGLLLEYGTYPGPTALMAARVLSSLAMVLFLVEQALSLWQWRSFRRYLRQRWPTFVLSVMLMLETLGLVLGRDTVWLSDLLGRLAAGSLTRAYLLLVQIYIISIFVVELPHLHQRFARWRVRPAVAFVLVFVFLIVAGTGLLLLPRATPQEQPISLLDAAFTATSAVCVTGLIVRDTATGFTPFGQTILLILIQLGGLGIMSLTATLSLLLGRGIGVRESSLLREVFHVPMMAEAGRMVRQIILLALALEALGFVLLYQGLGSVLPGTSERAFSALFHAVSAFCNAGFSLFGDSLMGVAGQPLVMGTVSGLLILGGLGFGVLFQVWAWCRGRWPGFQGRRPRFDLHTRVVLGISLGLLLAGTVLVAALEWNGALAGAGWPLKLSQAFFQGATCRTAGFNSMDLTTLSPAILFFMIILMFIGGAPGGTAGGVKVTAVAIVWANLRSVGSGLARVRLGNREIEPVQVHRSLLVMTSFLVLAAVAIMVLLFSEGRDFLTTTFEVFSALGTVGLSLGMTPELTMAGRVVIALLMFVGRLGPLTLAGSLVGAAHEPRVRLPRGRVLIG